MKALVFIISFLVLSLSSKPCCVEHTEADQEGIETACNDQKQHEQETPCSPFFNCGSCACFALPSATEFCLIQETPQQTHPITFESFLKSTFQNPDFKPPKVG